MKLTETQCFFILGIANWCIFLNHIPGNVVSLLTLRNLGFSGPVDLLVFAAGYSAAVTYGRMASERGLVVAATRVLGRALRLYGAYLVLFVAYVVIIAYVARRSGAPEITQEYNLLGIIDQPVQVLLHAMLLQVTPSHLDVLKLLMVLLAGFPLALWGLSRRPNLTLLTSIAIYLLAYQFGWNLAAFPDGVWRFNPFSWQLLLALGAWFAATDTDQMPGFRDTWLWILATTYVLFAALIMRAHDWPLAGLVPQFLVNLFTPKALEELTPYRIMHLIALLYLFTRAFPREWGGPNFRLLHPLLLCGEEWLPVFCTGVFLSFIAHFVLITGPNLVALQMTVSVAGLAAMTLVAYYVAWSRRQDRLRGRERMGCSGL
jgi:hypothetical protein